MKNKKLLTVVVLIVCLTGTLFARDLSLDDAVSIALKENLQIKNAQVDLRMSDVAYIYSYNTLLPTANATATFTQQNEVSGSPNRPVAFTYGISGSWTFNPAMITSIRIAYQNYKNGQITYSQACDQMKQNIRKLYFALVLQQKSLDIQKATLQAQKARYIQAQRDWENGYIPEVALLQSRVAYENAKPTLEQAEISLDASKRQFAFLLGLDTEEELNLTTEIDHAFIDMDADKALSTIEERYDIKSVELQEKLIKMQKEALIESTFLPSIVLNASWQPYLFDINKKGKDYWVDGGSMSGTVAWNLSNLLPTSGQYKSLSDINNGLKKIENGKEMAYENARIEILNLIDKLNQAKTTLLSSEGTVELAQANFDAREQSYIAGTSDFLDLQDAENQLSQAKLGRLSNQYNYITALIDLEYATGQQIF